MFPGLQLHPLYPAIPFRLAGDITRANPKVVEGTQRSDQELIFRVPFTDGAPLLSRGRWQTAPKAQQRQGRQGRQGREGRPEKAEEKFLCVPARWQVRNLSRDAQGELVGQ